MQWWHNKEKTFCTAHTGTTTQDVIIDVKAPPPSRNKGGALAPPSTKKRVEAYEEEYILSTGNLIRQTNLVTSDGLPSHMQTHSLDRPYK